MRRCIRASSRFGLVFEVQPDGIDVFDLAGKIVGSWRSAYYQFFELAICDATNELFVSMSLRSGIRSRSHSDRIAHTQLAGSKILVIRSSDGSELRSFPCESCVDSLEVSADGSFVYVAGREGVTAYTAHGGIKVGFFDPRLTEAGNPGWGRRSASEFGKFKLITLSPDGLCLFVAWVGATTLQVFSLTGVGKAAAGTGSIHFVLQRELSSCSNLNASRLNEFQEKALCPISDMCFDASGQLLLASGLSGKVQVWS